MADEEQGQDGDRFAEERRFAERTLEKRRLKEREREINAELAELEERIKERWEHEGVRGVPLTNATLGLRKEGFVRVVRSGEEITPEERRAACEALKAAGYGDFVTEGFNTQSVSAVAREEHWDRDLPPDLEGKVMFEPEYKISVRVKKPKSDDEEQAG